MKTLAIKIVVIVIALVTLVTLRFSSSAEVIGCQTAQDCVGSAFTTCTCPDGGCKGCLRRENGFGCGKCASCTKN